MFTAYPSLSAIPAKEVYLCVQDAGGELDVTRLMYRLHKPQREILAGIRSLQRRGLVTVQSDATGEVRVRIK